MPISAKWKHKSSIHIGFIVFNGGVTTFFAKSVFVIPEFIIRMFQLCAVAANTQQTHHAILTRLLRQNDVILT